jgi:hypothetical protein
MGFWGGNYAQNNICDYNIPFKWIRGGRLVSQLQFFGYPMGSGSD